MKYISKYKSPNYNSRNNSKIKFIIIHYTALKNTTEAISILCNKRKKVSSHYLISTNGTVYNLVNDKFRAWHAGESFWQNFTDINLYTDDLRHPSKEGTYLAALMIFTSLSNKTPVGNSYTMGLDPEIAKILQKAAWLTHKDFKKRIANSG